MSTVLAFDIGSNSVGSAWIDRETGKITTGISIFPAGVDESDDKRGDPKNAKRRMARRTRITLRRRAQRKRELRLKLIEVGLLPCNAAEFKALLEQTDPWALRRAGLDKSLTPHEFGRVLLHLAQRRGALGLKIADEDEATDSKPDDEGKVKQAIGAVRIKIRDANARTFGELIAMERDIRIHALPGPDLRPEKKRVGPREYRDAIRNKAGNYEHCADRPMIRDEFAQLWIAQKKHNSDTARLLTDSLRTELDNEEGDSTWRHKGLLFGQRRQSWDLGTLGRCVLEPTERCVPHADMYASQYRVVETVNNLRIIERGKSARPLTEVEREKIKEYLSGPLGMSPARRMKGKTIPERPKATVSVSDLRILMGWPKIAGKTPEFRFNIESDEDRDINTDWFNREIVHGAIGKDAWQSLSQSVREGINRAILRYDPDQDGDATALKTGVMKWAGLSDAQADALVSAWTRRPKIDAKRLNLSRRAVRNLLAVMDRPEPWPDARQSGERRWVTQIEARKIIAKDDTFKDITTGRPLDVHTRRRYATGAKGATAADRHYMNKHLLMKNGQPVCGPDGLPLREPPPAPLISNPVVRKAIHEVRRHVVEYMTTFGRRPDDIHIELAREARMGAVESDRVLFRNRLRNRIRRDIISEFNLDSMTPTQQRTAVNRVVLCMQQGGMCALCGNQIVKTKITPRIAAEGDECEVAHIIPRGSGGHNGLGNIVLAHTKCNRDMARRTPRQYWNDSLKGGFDEGYRWIEGIYGEVDRPKPSEMKKAEGDALWMCYFDRRDDKRKMEQFAKDVKDIQDMTARQEAATKYASRQVMAYLSDSLFEGKGLPERATGMDNPEDERRIFANDGMWTSRLRREWGLFFDPHGAKSKSLSNDEEHFRREKNRGDHRHHAIDAIVIAYCTPSVQIAWENRERAADVARINTADEVEMENYRRRFPIPPPSPFKSREEFRDTVEKAVLGDDVNPRPICHRAVKRKLIGALHEETLFGPVVDESGALTGNYTAKKSVLALTPNHLRMPAGWNELEAKLHDGKVSRSSKRDIRRSLAQMNDPPPGKSGIVRDRALRNQIRRCLHAASLDPDKFAANQIKKVAESGAIRQLSGVPIRSVVLLRTMSDPVVIARKSPDYISGKLQADPSAAACRAYVGGNNHHIEIRESKKGKWSGEIVSAFEAAQRKLRKLKEFKKARIPRPCDFEKLPDVARKKLRPIIRGIELAHPLVNRTDDETLGGRFIMSLCEGETVWMLHKETKEPGYFVVAKLDKPQQVVLVPHWDARAAGERKDSSGNAIPDSARESFTATPSDLLTLAPPGHPHAIKVRVSPLGVVTKLEKD